MGFDLPSQQSCLLPCHVHGRRCGIRDRSQLCPNAGIGGALDQDPRLPLHQQVASQAPGTPLGQRPSQLSGAPSPQNALEPFTPVQSCGWGGQSADLDSQPQEHTRVLQDWCAPVAGSASQLIGTGSRLTKPSEPCVCLICSCKVSRM